MDETRPPEGPLGGDIWNDVPLFREIQRVLLSSHGPVNWELARQVGIATASSTGEDPAPSDAQRAVLAESARLAELQVADFTGLEPPRDLATIEAVRRTEWVERNLSSLRDVAEPAVVRLGEALATAQRELMPEGATGAGVEQLLAQVSPLLLGTQIGGVLGSLGQQVLGQYDIAIPRPDGATLLFVMPNIVRFEREWSLDATEFRTWIAIHEVTHRFEFARPWALDRFRELLDDFSATLRLDVDALRQRLGTIDPADPEALRGVFESDEGVFGPILDDEQRLKLGRIQAFMASAEGYGDHVTHTLGERMLASSTRIDEAMRRYRESEQVDPVLERLLGVEVKREQYRLGRAFCDAVAAATDESVLSRMWDSAEALPSLPELAEPSLWLARSA